jgi:hypothetical protein
MKTPPFLFSAVIGHLGCSQVFAITHYTAVSIFAVSWCTSPSVSIERLAGVELLGDRVTASSISR